ncbi:uncharacterized protein STEHIDRAFT_121444 [Stereum hirsutum FP-91666 SS1]|uniref:uncharacterized protein n=1 Tax=Stereum hirsutum (strain FP-91666) TaxID=721885 RepID=UPI000440E75E|nr:uncharacterized protein STEHIDRAFT_121444 [Stereum hirsutum FP-91666 SS1]EIM86523.1 hypothetical protein STEHIDRAFT_121444 [Stereum hirsutum FP-91666 SS1]
MKLFSRLPAWADISSGSEAGGRPGKRRRSDNPETVLNVSDIVQHPQLWFPDGNIVVVAPNYMAYRLHKGLLSHRSEIFRDMLSADHILADEMCEGCDVVRIHDSSEDIRCFFEILYSGSCFSRSDGQGDVPGFSALCSVYRMSTKYFVQDFRNGLEREFLAVFPSQLDRYCSYDCGGFLNRVNCHPILAITLGEFLLPAILPVAYYECALRDIKETLDGVYIDGKCVSLSLPNQRTALLFRQAYYEHKFAQAKFGREFASCMTANERSRCGCYMRGDQLATTAEATFFDVPGCNILRGSVLTGQVPASPPCSVCQAAISRIETRRREALWALLPKFCGREGWEELQRQHGARDDVQDPQPV